MPAEERIMKRVSLRKMNQSPKGEVTYGPEETVETTPIIRGQFEGVSPLDLDESSLQLLLNAKRKEAARMEAEKATPMAKGITRFGTTLEELQVPASRRSLASNKALRGVTKQGVLLDEVASQPNLTPEERTRVRSMINELRAKQGKRSITNWSGY